MNNTIGKRCLFPPPKVRDRWIWNIHQFFLSAWEKLIFPPEFVHLRDYDAWKRFILSLKKNEEGKYYWHVHFAKPTKNAWRTAKYLYSINLKLHFLASESCH